jgi:hypothetical protein
MRDFKAMKRQRGRNRGGGSSGGKPQQNANRAFDSTGPDNIKVRGHAQHVFEKYQQLSRDAASAGDRVLAENFLQHAEHYFRVLRTLQPNRPASDFVARDPYASGYDIDFEDESGAQALADESPTEGGGEGQGGDGAESPRGDFQNREPRWEARPNGQRDDRGFRDRDRNRPDRPREGYRADGQEGEASDRFRDERPREERPREERPRDERPRDDRPREDRGPREERNFRDQRPREERPSDQRPRDERPRDERPRDERPRDDRPRDERPPREDRLRDDRSREDRPREERNRERFEPRAERDPLAVVEPQAQPLTSAAATPAPAPPVADEGAGVLRSRDGEVSHAPAFLQAPAVASAAPAADDATPVKRPRGRPRKIKAEAE